MSFERGVRMLSDDVRAVLWAWIIGSVVSYVFMGIVGYFIFQKAKVKGWKAFIPVYNSILYFDIMKSSDYFYGMVYTGGLICWLGFVIPRPPLNLVLQILGALICTAFQIYICVSGAKRFGKSVGFAVGLILLPVIFFPILAFGKSTYHSEL